MPTADTAAARAVEQHYAVLDDCPDDLLQDVVTLLVGTLDDRVAGIRAWRASLLDGELPPPDTWPPPSVGEAVRRALKSMGLVRLCKDQPELVDALLRDIARAFVRQADAARADVAARLAELEILGTLERMRHADSRAQPGAVRRPATTVQLDDEARARLRAQAEREVAAFTREADAGLVDGWGEWARVASEIAEAFRDLGEVTGRGGELALGALRLTRRLDAARLDALVAQLPALRDVVRAVGRLHETTDGVSVAQAVFVPVRRLDEERREFRAPRVAAETRGVERSGETARMLPAEACMFGHPSLKILWHARRAERALLTYCADDVASGAARATTSRPAADGGARARTERGPVVVVLDAAGPADGAADLVARALALEAARTAHAENRRCLVVARDASGDHIEQDVSLAADGVESVLALVGTSFGGRDGSTDLLARVLASLEPRDRAGADVVLVADAGWRPPKGLVAAIRAARGKRARFHGVQIGSPDATGLRAVCEPVHVFPDWAAAGGW